MQMVLMIRLTEGLFDKSRMKRPDICEAMKSRNFVLAPSTPGIRSAQVTRTLQVSPSYVKNAIDTLRMRWDKLCYARDMLCLSYPYVTHMLHIRSARYAYAVYSFRKGISLIFFFRP